jgi:hypothetical protein
MPFRASFQPLYFVACFQVIQIWAPLLFCIWTWATIPFSLFTCLPLHNHQPCFTLHIASFYLLSHIGCFYLFQLWDIFVIMNCILCPI